jgi:hypothetical protein
MRPPPLLVRTIAAAIPLALAFGPLPAGAAPTVYYHAGAWHAFTDKTTDGKDVCGIGTTNPTDGRDLTLTYTIGGDNLDFHASKPNWTIPDNTQLNVTMQVDSNEPWPAEAAGQGTSIDWSVGAASIRQFDTMFRNGGTLTIGFPQGNEPRWNLSLAGSTAASQTLWRCVQDISERDHVVNPASNTPPPTQPFTPPEAATQPVTPQAAPTQPDATQPAQTQSDKGQPAPTQSDQGQQPGGAGTPAPAAAPSGTKQ